MLAAECWWSTQTMAFCAVMRCPLANAFTTTRTWNWQRLGLESWVSISYFKTSI